MKRLVSTLHDATHQVPGIPAHRLRDRQEHVQNPNSRHQAPPHHQSPPRVLIAWQNWIGQLVGRNTHEQPVDRD